jgi:hypothetical protein
MLLRRLADAIAPIFAMGPAWTVLRAIAFPSDVPEALIEEKGEAYFREFQALRAGLGDKFGDSKAIIMRTLAAMAGDPGFESELHASLRRLAEKYKGVVERRAYGRLKSNMNGVEAREDDEAKLRELTAAPLPNGSWPLDEPDF